VRSPPIDPSTRVLRNAHRATILTNGAKQQTAARESDSPATSQPVRTQVYVVKTIMKQSLLPNDVAHILKTAMTASSPRALLLLRFVLSLPEEPQAGVHHRQPDDQWAAFDVADGDVASERDDTE